MFWRSTLQQQVGDFDPQFKLAGDLDWWLRAGPDRRYCRVDEMLAVERDHADAKRMSQWSRLLLRVGSRSSSSQADGARPEDRLVDSRTTPWLVVKATALVAVLASRS